MILQGDCRIVMQRLPAGHFNTCVTSPPYWGLRDYGIPPSDWPEVSYSPIPGLQPITVPAWTGCLGLEPTPEMFVGHMVLVFREVWRVLRDDGTLWMNFGDSYAAGGRGGGGSFMDERRAWKESSDVRGWRAPTVGLKKKDLVGIPWRVAFALQADAWYLRSDIIWHKPNPMPESVQDRPTKAHEYIFLLSKSERYYYDKEAIKEPGVQDEWANGFRGGAYTEGSTFDNQQGGKRKISGNIRVGTGVGFGHGTDAEARNRGRIKTPSGWDTAPGSHGTIHRSGQSRANSFARTVNEQPIPGQPVQHRPDREHVEYSGMRNKRSVWTVATQPFPEAHFATYPEMLIEPCILAGCPVGGHVLDPFGGSGTTMKVALENNRQCTLIEINPAYIVMQERRTAVIQPRLI